MEYRRFPGGFPAKVTEVEGEGLETSMSEDGNDRMVGPDVFGALFTGANGNGWPGHGQLI